MIWFTGINSESNSDVAENLTSSKYFWTTFSRLIFGINPNHANNSMPYLTIWTYVPFLDIGFLKKNWNIACAYDDTSKVRQHQHPLVHHGNISLYFHRFSRKWYIIFYQPKVLVFYLNSHSEFEYPDGCMQTSCWILIRNFNTQWIAR
jgi:hypothetical protein